MECQLPHVQNHVRRCADCADVLALVRRAVAGRNSPSQMTEEEAQRVATFVVNLIRDLDV